MSIGPFIITFFVLFNLFSAISIFGKAEYGIAFFTAIFILFVFIIGFCGLIISEVKTDKEPYVVHEIVGLSDNFLVSGRISLRSGYIDQSLCYTYGYKTAFGGMKIQNVRCANAEVFMIDGVKPRAEWFHRRSKFWFIYGDDFPICKIYLPTGSIIEDCVIDFN